ncbi:MAG: iron-sulfur cluster assembly protein [Nanoarchaeota archaeon]|nr:iron-sulfur cluster assembly protein [Nanoarchaeota archaeon]MBU4033129.1 iron-sulfur cluster assembly protein [Candidatus Thermoplasmatota archaeon]MBU4123988.1 iron-sulfur cluster assembly protein [Nanoarchaeota archaeon]
MSVSKAITDVLKKIKDPHIGKDIVSAKMVKNIKVVGKKVTLTLVMPDIGCAGCGMVFGMINEIKSGLKKKGYKAEIEVGQ